MISKEKKAELIQAYGRKEGDTGSPEGLLDYLKKNDLEGYRALIEKLGIRK